jgi:hypothetical protein
VVRARHLLQLIHPVDVQRRSRLPHGDCPAGKSVKRDFILLYFQEKNMPDSKKKPIHTGGESMGRDRTVSTGNGSVVIGGGVNNSIVTGNHNRIDAAYKFSTIFTQIDDRPNLSATDKSDLKTELRSFEDEDKKGPESNEGFLAQKLRNIRRIAPDILDVAIATIVNPAAGFGMIAKKVAEKMKTEAK